MHTPRIYNSAPQGPIVTKKFSRVGETDRSYVILNEKQKEKFIKTVERIVRTSQEYKDYIQYLKEYIDMKECSFFSNVNNRYNKKIRIEIHHEPLTLYYITQIVVDKWIKEDWELNPILIAEEVMKVHYENKVGLIPLSKTVHTLVHSGSLFIPLQNVYGRYVTFIKEYEEYISSDIMAVIENKLKISKELNSIDENNKLEKKFIYLEVEGWNLPQIIEKEGK